MATKKAVTNPTTTTATVVTKAATALETATTNIQKQIDAVNGLATTATEQLELIQERQATLAGLDAELTMALRGHDADLAMKIRENEDRVLRDLLNSNYLAYITSNEVVELRSQLTDAQDATDAAVKREVAIVTNKLAADHRAALASQESAHAVQNAEATANVTRLESEKSFLTSQVSQLQQQIADEREARIKIAEASSGAVVVNTTGK